MHAAGDDLHHHQDVQPGIADVLGRPVTITSADPSSYRQITVVVRSGEATWQPDSTVVVAGSDTTASAPTGNDCCPPGETGSAAAADRCCGVMNFFTNPASAHTWLAAHPRVSAVVLTRQQALQLGIDIFGHLLDDGPDSTTTGDLP
jgi:hypothetical protein